MSDPSPPPAPLWKTVLPILAGMIVAAWLFGFGGAAPIPPGPPGPGGGASGAIEETPAPTPSGAPDPGGFGALVVAHGILRVDLRDWHRPAGDRVTVKLDGTVLAEGRELADAPWTLEVELDPGSHALEVTAFAAGPEPDPARPRLSAQRLDAQGGLEALPPESNEGQALARWLSGGSHVTVELHVGSVEKKGQDAPVWHRVVLENLPPGESVTLRLRRP